jgi:hypothetical protein
MPRSTIFQLYRTGKFCWWRKLKKTTDLQHVTDTFSHNLVSSTPWMGLELKTLVVIGTDCIGSCKSNYHTKLSIISPFPKCQIKHPSIESSHNHLLLDFNVTLNPLLLPARFTNRSHSMYGSSARSDAHRAVFCPNSVVSGWKN